MVFVTFHRFLLHFVNDRNSGLWEALEATQDVRSAEFKKPVKTWEYCHFCNCQGQHVMVFIAFRWFLFHFVSDRNERLKQLFTFHRFLLHFLNDRNCGFWEVLEASQNVRWSGFKKLIKTYGILTSSSCWRSEIEGVRSFSLVFIAFCERPNERLKQLFTFHLFLLHFVNNRNSGFRGALEGTQSVRWAESKKPIKTNGILTL